VGRVRAQQALLVGEGGDVTRELVQGAVDKGKVRGVAGREGGERGVEALHLEL